MQSPYHLYILNKNNNLHTNKVNKLMYAARIATGGKAQTERYNRGVLLNASKLRFFSINEYLEVGL